MRADIVGQADQNQLSSLKCVVYILYLLTGDGLSRSPQYQRYDSKNKKEFILMCQDDFLERYGEGDEWKILQNAGLLPESDAPSVAPGLAV